VDTGPKQVASYFTHLLERVLVTSRTATARKHQRNQHAHATPARNIYHASHPYVRKRRWPPQATKTGRRAAEVSAAPKKLQQVLGLPFHLLGKRSSDTRQQPKTPGSSRLLLTLTRDECLSNRLQRVLPARACEYTQDQVLRSALNLSCSVCPDCCCCGSLRPAHAAASS
jgi:hypothetical protein